jgi:hypothetical protein
MDKVIRDGKVAVLYSPGYGAGWFSWHGIEELLYDVDGYFGGADDLEIEWVDVGREFRITEYDGSESIEYKDEVKWRAA